jgi:hypothetical protein
MNTIKRLNVLIESESLNHQNIEPKRLNELLCIAKEAYVVYLNYFKSSQGVYSQSTMVEDIKKLEKNIIILNKLIDNCSYDDGCKASVHFC